MIWLQIPAAEFRSLDPNMKRSGCWRALIPCIPRYLKKLDWLEIFFPTMTVGGEDEAEHVHKSGRKAATDGKNIMGRHNSCAHYIVKCLKVMLL